VAAYYNEIDPYAAEWLRNLIKAGHIAPGVVDERSIEDVCPSDLSEFTQCHFFAGIGVWSYALRNAGWPDDRPVWTGSCPCQPFSAAGKGAGFADERHLWPAWHWLISQRKPPVVFGEQVASKDAEPWLDLVSTDLEGLGFAFGAIAFPSAGIGAPHIRDRTFFVADASIGRGRARNGQSGACIRPQEPARRYGVLGGVVNTDDARPQGWQRVSERPAQRTTGPSGLACLVADSSGSGRRSERPHGNTADCAEEVWPGETKPGRRGSTTRPGGTVAAGPINGFWRDAGWMAYADGGHPGTEGLQRSGKHGQFAQDGRIERIESACPTNGYWRDADWLLCRDGKWRPIEPGTFPLAHGATSRVGRLRAYGNAINASQAEIFIRSAAEAIEAYDLI
jgi:DNA (cytosine-5)-methyltransferase 1